LALKNLRKYLLSQSTLIIGATLLVAILVRSPLSELFDSLLMDPVLSKVTTGTINDIVFILFSIVWVCLIVVGFLKRTLVGNDWVLLATIFALLFITVRWMNILIYREFSFWKSLKYADVSLLIVLGLITLKVNELVRKNIADTKRKALQREIPISNEPTLLDDAPITSKVEDRLKRSKFADRVAQRILSIPRGSKSVAIGITGKWGTGKTSFINLINRSLFEHQTKDDRIIIEFNAWRSSSPETIVQDFFDLLTKELRKEDVTLAKNVYSYAKTLTHINENVFTRTVQALAESFSNDSQNEIYEGINKSLKKINKQIVVLIDDLDRLDTAEVVEVLRIIRNTGAFTNMVYIAAYDKDYVHEAVKAINQHNYQSFLEKIFQFEFNLPHFDRAILRSMLKEQLSEASSDISSDILEQVINHRLKGEIITDMFVQTAREVLRLSNAFHFEITGIANEVFIYDFYLLQLIKLKYPVVYRGILEYQSQFFIRDVMRDKVIKLRNENEQQMENNLISEIIRSTKQSKPSDDVVIQPLPIFHIYLENLKTKEKLTDYDVNVLKMVTAELLSPEREFNKGFNNDKAKSIVYTDNFYKYFAFDLMDGDISRAAFETMRNSSLSEYLQWLEEIIHAKKGEIVFDFLYKVNDFGTVGEFENHLTAFFRMGKEFGGNRYSDGIDYLSIIETIRYPVRFLHQKLSLYDNEAEYKIFLKNLFYSQSSGPRMFESNLVSKIIDHNNELPYYFVDLVGIPLLNLRNYLSSPVKYDMTFFNLRNACNILRTNYEGVVYQDEAVKLGRQHYQKFADADALEKLIRMSSPGSGLYHIDKGILEYFFKDYQALDAWLPVAPKVYKFDRKYLEFKNFFMAFKANELRPIQFDFVQMAPPDYT
jgi:uncharacterized protein YejL (UPF0352 family)